jgi:putative flippase GtrA
MTRKSLKRFIHYASIGVATFLLDLGLLYGATTYAGVPYYLATAGSFLIAVSCNYFLSRRHIFKGTSRSLHAGYAYFALVGIGGALLTTGLVVIGVTYLHLYYLLARILVAGTIGIGNYLFNLYFNFKVAGNHA